jgi:hypothetical protein
MRSIAKSLISQGLRGKIEAVMVVCTLMVGCASSKKEIAMTPEKTLVVINDFRAPTWKDREWAQEVRDRLAEELERSGKFTVIREDGSLQNPDLPGKIPSHYGTPGIPFFENDTAQQQPDILITGVLIRKNDASNPTIQAALRMISLSDRKILGSLMTKPGSAQGEEDSKAVEKILAQSIEFIKQKADRS